MGSFVYTVPDAQASLQDKTWAEFSTFKSGCVHAVHFLCYGVKLPIFKLKTWTKQLHQSISPQKVFWHLDDSLKFGSSWKQVQMEIISVSVKCWPISYFYWLSDISANVISTK